MFGMKHAKDIERKKRLESDEREKEVTNIVNPV